MKEKETFVYRKMENPYGDYIDKDGKRWEIQFCHCSEEREMVQIGTTTDLDEEGNKIEVPVFENQIIRNRGWDKFDSLEEAIKAYDLEEIENGNN